jgi:hypothetical protein
MAPPFLLVWAARLTSSEHLQARQRLSFKLAHPLACQTKLASDRAERQLVRADPEAATDQVRLTRRQLRQLRLDLFALERVLDFFHHVGRVLVREEIA